MPANKSLQRTFEPSDIFVTAKTVAGSNAAELQRYVAYRNCTDGSS